MNHDPNEDPLFAVPAEDASDQEARRRRQRLFNLLRGRWRWVLLLAAVLGTSFAAAGYYSQETLYASSGKIQLTQYLPNPTRSGDSGWTTNEFLQTEMSLIKTPRVLELVAQDEGWRKAAGQESDKLSTIHSAIDVRNETRTNLVNISFIHRDPDVALAGLRAVMSAHKKAFGNKYENIDAKALQQLTGRQADKTRELVNLRAQRDNLTKDVGAENLDGPYNDTYKRRQGLEKALYDVRMALIAMGAEVGQAESPLASMTDEQLAEIDQTMAHYFGLRANIEFEMQTLRNKGFGESHRGMRDYQAQLRTVEDNIANHGNQLRQGLVQPRLPRSNTPSMTENDTIDGLKQKEAQLQQELEQVKGELIDIGRKNIAIKSLNTDIGYIERELREINDRIESMNIAEIGEHIEVINSGARGQPYNGATRIKRAMMGGVFGTGCALALVLLWGVANRRFRHIDDAELDLPRVLGSLPTLPEKFLDPEEGVLVAHAVHHIRTLLQIGREDTTNVFSITSPTAGSGKTSLTMALGLSFASAGSRTLLVDGDVVGGGLTRRMNATAHRRLGQILLRMGKVDQHAIDEALKAQQVSGKRLGEALVGLGYVTRDDITAALREQRQTSVGLLEACDGEEFGACTCKTSVDRLDVLPIGTALPQQAGILSPNAVKRIIGCARAAYDTVLIDTGPILGSIEASMAAAESDGSILIITRGDKKGLVDKCIEHFRRIKGNLIGVVFNHALRQDIARSNYGSVTASQSRHPNQQSLIDTLDADTSARYGPLATAVAAYGGRGNLKKGNGQTPPTSKLAG